MKPASIRSLARRKLLTAAVRLAPAAAFVPPGIRRFLFARLFRSEALAAFERAAPAAALGSAAPGLNIIGYIRGELGIGESARLCAGAAAAAGIPFVLNDVGGFCQSRTADATWEARITENNPYAVNCLHVSPDQVPVVFGALGRRRFADKYNIGFWHWELPEIPAEWTPYFRLFHEIWVASDFVREAVARASPVPVLRMPLPVAFEVPPRPDRPRFGLPARTFLFLTMYDMKSVSQRKNPEAAVRAFQRAFGGCKDVGLVVKTQNAAADPRAFEALRQAAAAAGNVHLLSATLSRREVYELENACDAFISLHRSEGFGLGLAECMFLGKPVIATGWSGNMDFMNERNACPVRYTLTRIEADAGPYKKGQTWAEPDVEHAARLMAELVSDPGRVRQLGRAAQETLRTNYSFARIGALYAERLVQLRRAGDEVPTPNRR